jgi:hypothetical protein
MRDIVLMKFKTLDLKKDSTQILNQAYKEHVGFEVLAAVDTKKCLLGYHAV